MGGSRRIFFNSTVFAGGAALALLACSAAAEERTYQFDIPQERLTKALRDFAIVSGQQIIFTNDLIGNRQAPALKGVFTLQQGLARLLQGADLSVRPTQTGALMIQRSAARAEWQGVANHEPVFAPTEHANEAVAPSRPSPMLFAQVTESAKSASAAQDAAPAPANASPAASEVVVTGSRVIKNGNNSPTPVTVVSVDQLMQAQPGSIAEAVASLPVFSGSYLSVSNPGTGVTNNATNVLDLRNLGWYETLVLFDGHRVPPSTFDQLVDVSIIPQMLLQRVDVVTGGASAVYGSDAVSGVVNFVTDSKFNGLKFDVSGGISQLNDDRTVRAGIAVGTNLGDRGHVEASYEYLNDPGIAHRSDRQWGRYVWTLQGAGTVADPWALVENTRSITTSHNGLITSAPAATGLTNMIFAQNGVLGPFINGAPTGNATVQSGGSGGYGDASLKAATGADRAFGRLDYNFTDAVHGYIAVSAAFTHHLNYGSYNALSNVVMNGQDPFFPVANQFVGTFKFSEQMTDVPRIDTDTQQNQYLIVGGLDGKFGDGYAWELSAEDSHSHSVTRDDNQINNQNLYAALDAVKDPSGNIVCHVTLTNPGLYPGCVPLNPFGPTTITPAMWAYINQASQFTVDNGMVDVSGSLTGAPIKDWAGPINMAISGEWRNQTVTETSTALPTAFANCTGLTITGATSNCSTATKVWADATLANLPQVSNSVWEVAYEMDAPLIKDMPFAKDVSFNGAVRYTDYKTSGAAVSAKLGLIWQVDDQWKLRATRSRDIRAPTLYDLFQPQSSVLGNVGDSLTGITQPAFTVSGGNPNLKPEIGNTTTAGVVYSPNWLPRFTLSVDAYYIDVSSSIQSQKGANPSPQALCYASGGSSLWCSLQVRPLGNYTNTSPANTATTWYNVTFNASDLKSYGADIEANYAATVFSNPLMVRTLVTWLPHTIIYTPNVPDLEQAGLAISQNASAPVWKGSLFVDYKVNKFDIAVTETGRSQLSLVEINTEYMAPGTRFVGPAYWTALNVSYHLNHGSIGSSELYLNVQNLFNAQPQPVAGEGQAGSVGVFGGFAIGDDPIGRYFTLGWRFRH